MGNRRGRAKPDGAARRASAGAGARKQGGNQRRSVGPDVPAREAVPREAVPGSRPPGTGEAGELGEPDSGVPTPTADEE